MKGWMKFLGILNIIAGVSVLTLATLLALDLNFNEYFPLILPLFLVGAYDLAIGISTMKYKHKGLIVGSVFGLLAAVGAWIFFLYILSFSGL